MSIPGVRATAMRPARARVTIKRPAACRARTKPAVRRRTRPLAFRPAAGRHGRERRLPPDGARCAGRSWPYVATGSTSRFAGCLAVDSPGITAWRWTCSEPRACHRGWQTAQAGGVDACDEASEERSYCCYTPAGQIAEHRSTFMRNVHDTSQPVRTGFTRGDANCMPEPWIETDCKRTPGTPSTRGGEGEQADSRLRLGMEATLLIWIRTGLSLMGFRLRVGAIRAVLLEELATHEQATPRPVHMFAMVWHPA